VKSNSMKKIGAMHLSTLSTHACRLMLVDSCLSTHACRLMLVDSLVDSCRNTSGYTIASNNRTTAGQGFTYTYDDEGNRLMKTEISTGKVQSFEWDFRNRLVTVTGGSTLWGLADHLGSLHDIADRNDSMRITTVTNHRSFSVTGKLVSETNAAVDLLFAFTGE